ncbi:MAG: trypsin-like peptidase domain-containing protein, partial [Planctomycetaceae bacterium]
FVKNGGFDTNEVTIRGTEAADLVARLTSAPVDFMNVLPLIGRFEVVNFPGIDFVGTGWFVDHDIVITNRHVASLIARWDGRRFAFTRGVAGRPIEASLCNAHELDDTTPDESNVFKVVEVLFIERDDGPDIAFVRVARPAGGSGPRFIALAENDPGEDVPVCVVGYPAKAPRHVIPDQALMQDLFRNRFDVKRAAPGYFLGVHDGNSEHDCTTLGGNSGSVVLDFHGRAVGLHFAGQYMESNFAVPVSVLAQYVSGKRWNQPIQIAERSGEPVKQSSGQQKTLPKQHDLAPRPADLAIQAATSATFTIPLTIRVELGFPVAGSRAVSPADAPQATGNDLSRVESAVRSYWRTKPEGVLAARVGFLDDGETIGDQPCIAVSVSPSRLPEFEARGQKEFEGIALSYYPAEVGEQIDAIPSLEAVESIAYDDDARGSEEFSFAPVNEELDITLHVGPEYSWEVLQKFLRDANG